jgi:transcriptional regulator with GAF, ATPase, and Fis domain
MTDSNETKTSLPRETLVLETLVQLADTLIQDYDVIEFLGMLSERCVALVDADEAGIMVTDGRGSLQVVASSSERSRLLELLELQNRDGPCLEAFMTGQPVSSADLSADRDRWFHFSREAITFGFQSVHSVPLRLRTQVIGALNLLRTQTGLMDRADQTLARALAQMATIGLLQERAVSASKIASAQLQTALTSRVRLEQAKGVIAERHSIDIDTAFERLRLYARSHHRQISDLALAIVRDDFDIDD